MVNFDSDGSMLDGCNRPKAATQCRTQARFWILLNRRHEKHEKKPLFRVVFLLSLAAVAGGFIGTVAIATLLHRFRFALDNWLPGASQLFLPAYFLAGIFMAFALCACKGQVSAKAALFPGFVAGIIGPYCGLILSMPIVCLIASECL